MADLRIAYMALDQLVPAPRNPKRHQIDALGASIGRFGYAEPIIVDERTGRMVAGHGRRETLLKMKAGAESPPAGIRKSKGEWLVPVVRGWRSNSDKDAEAYLVASNRHVELGGWADSELAGLLQDIELEGTGFSLDDVTELRDRVAEPVPINGDPDEVPDPPAAADVHVRPGEVWRLGDHRIMCGSCTSEHDVATLLDGDRINVAVTSPPYASQRAYDAASEFKPIPPDEYVKWFDAAQAVIARHLATDGSFFLNVKEHCQDGQRHLYVKDLTLAFVRQWGWRFVDEFCWRNTRDGVPGVWNNRFKNAWEPVFHFARSPTIKFRPLAVAHESSGAFVYSPDNSNSASGSGLLGTGHDRGDGMARPSNVLEIAAETGQPDHPAPFPVALPSFFVAAFSDLGDVVFDPFSGAASTLIACEQTKRRCRAMEISSAYVQLSINRWERLTGRKATREGKS